MTSRRPLLVSVKKIKNNQCLIVKMKLPALIFKEKLLKLHHSKATPIFVKITHYTEFLKGRMRFAYMSAYEILHPYEVLSLLKIITVFM